MMDIKSRGFNLTPRHLRRFNGAAVELFDGRRGKLHYPYLMVSEGDTKFPMMIEKRENFKMIHLLVLKKHESGAEVKVSASRKNKSSELVVQ